MHLASRGIQGWPKLNIEICAVNGFNKHWPVGFGFVHIPTKPGFHKFQIQTWKIAPNGLIDSLRDKFHSGGFSVSKSDLVNSGIERYKLSTKSSGIVTAEFMLIFKNITKFGVEV